MPWVWVSEAEMGAQPNFNTLPNSPDGCKDGDEGADNKGWGKYRKGWHADGQTLSAAPRWSIGRGGLQPAEVKEIAVGNCTRQKYGGKFRETFFTLKTLQQYTPGPGQYRKDVEFPMKGSEHEEMNTNLTIQEEAADYSIPKNRKEATLQQIRCDCLKASNLVTGQRGAPSNKVMFTPGPGTYTQYTSIGAASGGRRKHYN